MKETKTVYVSPALPLKALRTVLGVSLFFFLFYIVVGYFIWKLPFPTPGDLLEIFLVTGAGVGLGVLFSRFWPLPPEMGMERVVRTLLLVIPALGLGIALQTFLQGAQAQRALYFIFALAAWMGSGHIVRIETAQTETAQTEMAPTEAARSATARHATD